MHLEAYRKCVITGLISSIGSLTESLVNLSLSLSLSCHHCKPFGFIGVFFLIFQVKSASVPFLNYLRQLESHKETDQLMLIAGDIMEILRSHLGNVRFMPYMFSFLDHICSSGCLDPIFKTISQQLFVLVRAEMTCGSKPLKVVNFNSKIFFKNVLKSK